MKRIYLFQMIVIIFVFGTSKANACMCSGTLSENSIKSYFKSTDNIFQGKVLTDGKEKWEVSVSKVWKGDIENKVYVVDTFANSSCAGTLDKGKEYIFFVFSTTTYSTIKEFKKVDSPIRKNKLQVFFDTPCWFGGLASNWNQTLKNYDKENFWQTLEEKEPIMRKKL